MNKLWVFFRNLITRERWKPIKNYEGLYEISNFGYVKSLAREWINNLGKFCKKDDKILKNRLGTDGYFNVVLCKNGKTKTYRTHHLVYDHFGKRKRNGRVLQTDHIDGNKTYNWIGNLQLLSQRQNLSKGHLQNGKKTSQFSGVHWNEKDKRWRAQIWVDEKQKHLGNFKSENEAHIKYQKELKKILRRRRNEKR